MKPHVHPVAPFTFPLALPAVVLLSLLAGCHGTENLMPTPNLYADGSKDPFPDVRPELQSNKVEVLYLTDRKEEEAESTATIRAYGYGRSRSVGFGVATMEIGHNVSWDELVKASKTRKRENDLPLKVIETKELVRFAPTPKLRAELPPPAQRATMPTTNPSALQVEVEAQKEQAKKELAARLAKCDVKDVYLYVHGYNNNFFDSILIIGQLWHFMGRQGVPVAYSWPAGHGGLLQVHVRPRVQRVHHLSFQGSAADDRAGSRGPSNPHHRA
jgi:esterase/lipase superfamily enzyme